MWQALHHQTCSQASSSCPALLLRLSQQGMLGGCTHVVEFTKTTAPALLMYCAHTPGRATCQLRSSRLSYAPHTFSWVLAPSFCRECTLGVLASSLTVLERLLILPALLDAGGILPQLGLTGLLSCQGSLVVPCLRRASRDQYKGRSSQPSNEDVPAGNRSSICPDG